MAAATIQSVHRSINVLMALRSGPLTLTELARATNLSKGTTFRILTTLQYERVVVKDPGNNQYMIGPGLFVLLQGSLSSLGSLTSAAKPVLRDLRDKTHETVALHTAIGAERICIDEFQSEAEIKYSSHPGAAAPIHLGSAGKILLAYMDSDQRERVFDLLRPLSGDTSGRIANAEALRAELEAVRRQGWAMSLGERIADAAAISVPIRAHRFLIALSVLGPSARLSQERRLELLPDVQRAAARVEAILTSPGELADASDDGSVVEPEDADGGGISASAPGRA